ncbi:MAG: CCA tRNA nucleotidyltransferase, partial [Aquificae bacterium]|nr:CCA tRNA nucleotidyltransferase [Aquificota bacterium]
LISSKVLPSIIPEVEEMARIGKSGSLHKYPLLKHSIKTVEQLEEFLKKKSS